MINLKPLKKFVEKKLRTAPILHDLVLTESDAIPIGDFLLKSGTWLKILEMEMQRAREVE